VTLELPHLYRAVAVTSTTGELSATAGHARSWAGLDEKPEFRPASYGVVAGLGASHQLPAEANAGPRRGCYDSPAQTWLSIFLAVQVTMLCSDGQWPHEQRFRRNI